MTTKTRLTILLFATLAVKTMADPPLTVAVYDFRNVAEAGWRKYGSKVTALVTANLATQTNIILLERAELNKALNEQAFGVSGLVSADAAAKIGAITGAKVLVSGEVIMTEHNHLVVVANIIGTETGRLFAVKAEGSTGNLMELTSTLSSNISQTISSQATNFLMTATESSAARLDRIVKNLAGTNRPSIAVNIFFSSKGKPHHSATAEGEFGAVLLKAGFPVVDGNSEHKPDVEIKGVGDLDAAPGRGQLHACRAVIELKVQDRRTGNIIAIDQQESVATDSTPGGASRSAQVQAVDELAARILPLLVK